MQLCLLSATPILALKQLPSVPVHRLLKRNMCRASSETQELNSGYERLGLRTKVLPHIIAFLWLPTECLNIARRVLTVDADAEQKFRT